MSKKRIRYLIFPALLIFIITASIVIKHTYAIMQEDNRIAVATKVYETLDKVRLKLRSTMIMHSYYIITDDQEFYLEFQKNRKETYEYYNKLKLLDYQHIIEKEQIDSLGVLLDR